MTTDDPYEPPSAIELVLATPPPDLRRRGELSFGIPVVAILALLMLREAQVPENFMAEIPIFAAVSVDAALSAAVGRAVGAHCLNRVDWRLLVRLLCLGGLWTLGVVGTVAGLAIWLGWQPSMLLLPSVLMRVSASIAIFLMPLTLLAAILLRKSADWFP